MIPRNDHAVARVGALATERRTTPRTILSPAPSPEDPPTDEQARRQWIAADVVTALLAGGAS